MPMPSDELGHDEQRHVHRREQHGGQHREEQRLATQPAGEVAEALARAVEEPRRRAAAPRWPPARRRSAPRAPCWPQKATADTSALAKTAPIATVVRVSITMPRARSANG